MHERPPKLCISPHCFVWLLCCEPKDTSTLTRMSTYSALRIANNPGPLCFCRQQCTIGIQLLIFFIRWSPGGQSSFLPLLLCTNNGEAQGHVFTLLHPTQMHTCFMSTQPLPDSVRNSSFLVKMAVTPIIENKRKPNLLLFQPLLKPKGLEPCPSLIRPRLNPGLVQALRNTPTKGAISLVFIQQ